MTSIYQRLSWQAKTDYQVFKALLGIADKLALVYFNSTDEEHADYIRLKHIDDKDVFLYVAGFPCPSHLHLNEAIANQVFQNDVEKTAFTIAHAWRRAKYLVNFCITESLEKSAKVDAEKVRDFVGKRKHDKESRLAQLELDCTWLASMIVRSLEEV